MLTTSPLVAAYLADLDRALAGAEPADRLEIVDSVAEHIDAAVEELGASPTQAQVAGVLRRLGTADDVAAAWAGAADRPLAGAYPVWSAPSAVALPAAGAARSTPTWVVVLLVLVGLAVLAPALLLVVGGVMFASVGSAPPGLPTIGVLIVLLVCTVALGIVWRRATTHRRAWLIGFIVALLVLLVSAGMAGLASRSGTAPQGGPTVVVETAP